LWVGFEAEEWGEKCKRSENLQIGKETQNQSFSASMQAATE